MEQHSLKKQNFVHIDPDAIRLMLPQYQEKLNIPNSKYLGKMRAYTNAASWCYSAGWALVEYCLRRMIEAKDNGYRILLYGVWAPLEVVKTSVLARALSTGRWVSRSNIDSFYTNISKSKPRGRETSFYFNSSGNTPVPGIPGLVTATTAALPEKDLFARRSFDVLAEIARMSGGGSYIFDNSGGPTELKLVYENGEIKTPGPVNYFLENVK